MIASRGADSINYSGMEDAVTRTKSRIRRMLPLLLLLVFVAWIIVIIVLITLHPDPGSGNPMD